ncbi:MAG TPA: hypothetical protein VLI91_14680 [Roseiarcus sp.]|nr:hypothetical protein [Roseiarcus sp.]
MTPPSGLRLAVFAVVALAALVGLVSRLAIAASDAGTATFVGVGALIMPAGQPFGRGTFDGTVDEGVPGVRLRAEPCAEPIYAAPIELKAVAFVEAADDGYLGHPGYSTTNVYHGRVRQTFSHLARVLARNPLTPYNLDYFIRFYVPPNCALDDEAYVDWATRILDLTIKPSQPAAPHSPG